MIVGEAPVIANCPRQRPALGARGLAVRFMQGPRINFVTARGAHAPFQKSLRRSRHE
jgi:hypothetical protein